MEKKFKIILSVVIVFVMCLLLGCIGFISMLVAQNQEYNDSSYYDTRSNNAYSEKSLVDTYGDSSEGIAEEDNSSEIFVSNEDENQKLVYSGSTALSTEDINKTYKELTNSFSKYNAKLESIDEGSTYKNLIIRVPKDNFMDFYNSLSELSGKITYSNISIDDMTKTYVDNERKIKTLEDEYNALSDLMSKAENVEDVLSIRDRMSEVSYELDSLKDRNNDIDYDAKYSRMEVSINLVGSSAEIGESFWHQLKTAFQESINIFRYLILGIVSIWWIIALVIILILGIKKRKELKSYLIKK